MNKLSQFTQTRDNILGVFQKAKQDLEELNKNISVEIADNEARIQTLQRDNASLLSLKQQNASDLSFFSKLFKSK
jgi:hypothetical protein